MITVLCIVLSAIVIDLNGSYHKVCLQYIDIAGDVSLWDSVNIDQSAVISIVGFVVYFAACLY
jgi:hypothetical protein